ncbi:hypothetical protein DRO66_02580 [Candidatus Bathyarchaeota archaeon]|nr:MAG: hypothetical protein DRO66_02580 [Candidatus Bathyarchaeota archaeon]
MAKERTGKKTKADRDMWTHRRASRRVFYKRYESYAAHVHPKYTKPDMGNLFWLRNRNLAIREASKRKVCIRFSYKRVSDRKSFSYLVEPYSFRYKRGRLGFRKFLYGYHRTTRPGATRGIHMFYWHRIGNIVVSRVPYIPRWRIETSYKKIPKSGGGRV